MQVLLHGLRLALAEGGLQPPSQQHADAAATLQEDEEAQEHGDGKRAVGLLELHNVLHCASKVRACTVLSVRLLAA